MRCLDISQRPSMWEVLGSNPNAFPVYHGLYIPVADIVTNGGCLDIETLLLEEWDILS